MVRNGVKKYLDHYKSAKQNGMGIEFAGQTLGTGKTFAATHIAKELIKQGENVSHPVPIDHEPVYERTGSGT